MKPSSLPLQPRHPAEDGLVLHLAVHSEILGLGPERPNSPCRGVVWKLIKNTINTQIDLK